MYLSSSAAAGCGYADRIYTTERAASSERSSSVSFGGGLRAARSVVDDFKTRNPDRARHVDQQVRAGMNYIEKNGLSADMTAAMTMGEYQAYIYALTDSIPYDFTRQNDTTVISISEQGWEQMRKDPKYEAWVIGYLTEDRSIRNPFYSWGDDGGSVISEHFGASIEEHHGTGFHKPTAPKDDQDDDREDWWIKRHKRIKKLIREQTEKKMRQDAAARTRFQKEYALRRYEEAQGGISADRRPNPDPGSAGIAAAVMTEDVAAAETGAMTQ